MNDSCDRPADVGPGSGPLTLPAGNKRSARITARHSYARPGTYFAVLRASSQREGDRVTPFGQIQNPARVRVIVE